MGAAGCLRKAKVGENVIMKRSMILVAICLIAVTGCGRVDKGKKQEQAIPVKVMKIVPRNLEKTLEYVGNITGQDEAMVYPKVGGKIIEKVKDDGSPIAKGEAIAYIDRDEVGLKFEKAPVESPLTGVVGRVYVDIGSNVTTQTPVAIVADMESAEVDLDIPEKYLPEIRIGQAAEIEVDAYPDEVFSGKVQMISAVVDLQTRAAPVEITIDNRKGRLRSGMYARVRLIIDEKKAVPVVLREAVIGKQPNTYVYVVDGDVVRFVPVKLGIRQGPYLEVTEGLKAGDQVVVMGQQKLRDGAYVVVEE